MVRYSMEHLIFIWGRKKKNDGVERKNRKKRELVRFTNTVSICCPKFSMIKIGLGNSNSIKKMVFLDTVTLLKYIKLIFI